MKNYLFTYDPAGEAVNMAQLLAFISSNKYIFQYYSPFVGTYILKSDAEAEVLRKSLGDYLQQSQFIIAEVAPDRTGGYLNPMVWTWFNNRPQPALKGQ